MAPKNVIKRDFGKRLVFDPDFQGPVNKRESTDGLWLHLYLVFLVVWIGVGVYAIVVGRIHMFAPTDSNDRTCGVDPDVSNAFNVLIFDLSRCLHKSCTSPKVCVNTCPKRAFVFTVAGCLSKGVTATKSKMICQPEVNYNQIASCEQIEQLVANDRCARWYLRSKTISQTCVPDLSDETAVDAIQDYITNSDLKLGTDILTKTAEIFGTTHHMIVNIYRSKYIIMIALLGATGLSIALTFVMRWRTELYVYGSIFFLAMIIAIKISQIHTNTVLLVVNSLILVLCIISLILLRKKVVSAITLITISIRSISDVPYALCFPVAPLVMHSLCFGFFVTSAMFILTLGEPTFQIVDMNQDAPCKCTFPVAFYQDDTPCAPMEFRKYCVDCTIARCGFVQIDVRLVTVLSAVNMVGYIWTTFFITAVSDLTLGIVFGSWYFTFNKDAMPRGLVGTAFLRVLRFHIGTAALGSLILTGIQIIGKLSEYFRARLEHSEHPLAAKALKVFHICSRFLFWFFEILTHDAYIVCAINGTPFFASTITAFNLMNRNKERIVILNTVTWVLFVMCKLVIVCVVGLAVVLYLNNDDPFAWPTVPVIVVMVGTLFICSAIFGVHTTAVDAVFICFLEDYERNDGSPQKPYYMHGGMLKILAKDA